ncbi:MAG: hypothetical protein J2P25_05195 [Nocardiopsaceae bacterium]|nr:hypothetical protein [Nocardiopsaceae bacterium]
MLSHLHREQEPVISCVTARVGETGPDRLAIADIVACHRAAPPATAAQAAEVFTCLPGCSVFLSPDGCGGYLAFARSGERISIRGAQGRGCVTAAAAEACAAVLYTWVCAGQSPSVVVFAAAAGTRSPIT